MPGLSRSLPCLLLVGWTGVAHADPITDRNYAIDFYDGVAIGDTAQVGMGGAGAALVSGSAGTLLNPSAPAVRRSTDRGRFDWDYHLDALTGRYSSDYDNNGTVSGGSGASLITLGLALRFGNLAFAATGTGQTTPIEGSASPELQANGLRNRFAVAYYVQRLDLAIGVGFQTVRFQVSPVGGGDALFAMTGTGGLVGATWVPRNERFRAGVSYEGEIHGGEVETSACDPNDCRGYILPNRVESPARMIAGLAYRWAATAWNQQVKTRFRDERSLTAAVDFVVTGPSENGNGIEAFGMHELQPSGRSMVVSLRGGVEAEVKPGRLRLRAGSYWEPARFEDVSGRIHGTFGADLRVFEFNLFGIRRGRISATADLASRYRNVALSIGFWH